MIVGALTHANARAPALAATPAPAIAQAIEPAELDQTPALTADERESWCSKGPALEVVDLQQAADRLESEENVMWLGALQRRALLERVAVAYSAREAKPGAL